MYYQHINQITLNLKSSFKQFINELKVFSVYMDRDVK